MKKHITQIRTISYSALTATLLFITTSSMIFSMHTPAEQSSNITKKQCERCLKSKDANTFSPFCRTCNNTICQDCDMDICDTCPLTLNISTDLFFVTTICFKCQNNLCIIGTPAKNNYRYLVMINRDRMGDKYNKIK